MCCNLHIRPFRRFVLALIVLIQVQVDVRLVVVAVEDVECIDLDSRCGDWASMGECDRNMELMSTNCRLSCEICQGEEDNDGEDEDEDDEEIEDEDDHDHDDDDDDNNDDYIHYDDNDDDDDNDDNDNEEEWDEDDEDDDQLPLEIFLAHGADMGEAQNINQNQGSRPQDLSWMIAKARNYMTHVVPTKFGEEMISLCRNHHRQCAYWAWKGECDQSPEYMRFHCAPMCQSCHNLTLESRCPLDPNAPNTWGPGDLNRMFERLTSEPYRSKYDVQVLSSPEMEGPWVITMENVVTEQEAQRLIQLGHQMGYKRSTDVGKRRADGTYTKKISQERTSTNAWCIDICAEDPVSQRVSERLSQLTGIPLQNSEHLQLLRYNLGEFYGNHHDMIEHHVTKQAGPRILTVFIYLNDVERGGGTHFEELDVTVFPKRGRVLIWPSVYDNNPNEKDWRTMHEALPVEEGIKYGANAWFHLRDYQTPNDNGCMT